MKKKLCTIFILVLLPFILSGCVKVNTEVTLDKKGHAQVESKFLVDDVLSDSLDDDFFDIEQYAKKKGLEVSKVSENGQIGTKYVFKTNNYNKQDIVLPDFIAPTNENNRFLTIKHNIFFTKTNIDWNVHFSELDNKVLTKDDQKLIEPSIKINIPAKANFSNADSRNDMTNSYEWKLDATKENKIQLEYKIINWLNIVLMVLFLASIISLIVLLVLKQNKKIINVVSCLTITLLIYFVSVCGCCFADNNTNAKPLPINYYNLAENDFNLFVDDFAIAKVEDKYGLVDKKNNFIVKPENKYIENLKGDYCLVCKEDTNACAYFNKKQKKYLTKFKYMCLEDMGFDSGEDEMTTSPFFEGLARVVVNDHGDISVGFIDGKGVEVIPLKYKSATNFVDGQAKVKSSYNSPEVVIDKTGKEIKNSNDKNSGNVANKTPTKNKQSVDDKNTGKKNETKTASKPKVVKQVKKSPAQQNIKQENNEVDDFMN